MAGKDLTCLAEEMVLPADFETTGINLNEIVIGPTGCGKSYSNAYSRLIHTEDSSIVVPIAKQALKNKFKKFFEDKGYEVIDLDFTHPEKCKIGYDPFDYIHSDEELVQVAKNLTGIKCSKTLQGENDPYWSESTTSVIAALMSYVKITSEDKGTRPRFDEVVRLYKSMKVDTSGKIIRTSMDDDFERLEYCHPRNQACEYWKTIKGLSSTTASCILSMVNNAFDKIFSENVLKMCGKEKRVSFRKLGNKKTAIFITTSPMNKTLYNLVNVMYSDMFRELFAEAESRRDGQLKVPVHILCDDFACGSRIPDFEEYISIFRAAGISVTLLLQSETQLINMYGETAAATIINNCDTYVYMGGMDITTCKHISERIDKSLKSILSMPLERVIVFRRGSLPVEARRYQILEDPLYKKYFCSEKGHVTANRE